MQHGYLYVLSNDSMPGVVKIGRTVRLPDVRAKELRTTGVPTSFKLEHFVRVRDCISAESMVHTVLQEQGYRTAPDREFFDISVTVAVDTINLVAGSDLPIDFSRKEEIAKLAATIKIPIDRTRLPQNEADSLAERLSEISRNGYPEGLRRCAELYEFNCPSILSFKSYFLEYLDFARQESCRLPLASGGIKAREAVGHSIAEYIAKCDKNGWLTDQDFEFISDFLVQGNQFEYSGYIEELGRYNLPSEVKLKAESV